MLPIKIPQQISKVLQTRTLATNSNYVKQRKIYNQQLSELRKVWDAEFKERAKIKAEAEAAERHKIVLQKSIKLREHRLISKQKEEAAKKRLAILKEISMKKLAYTHQLHDEKLAAKEARYQAFIKDLEQEKKTWITLDNYKEVITPALFSDSAMVKLTRGQALLSGYIKPTDPLANGPEKEIIEVLVGVDINGKLIRNDSNIGTVARTTGLKTRYSNMWQYQVHTPTYKKIIYNDDDLENKFVTDDYPKYAKAYQPNKDAALQLSSKEVEEFIEALDDLQTVDDLAPLASNEVSLDQLKEAKEALKDITPEEIYHILSLNKDKDILLKKYQNNMANSTPTSTKRVAYRLNSLGETYKKLLLDDMLNTMVGDGEEREKYDEIYDDMYALSVTSGFLDEAVNEYNESVFLEETDLQEGIDNPVGLPDKLQGDDEELVAPK